LKAGDGFQIPPETPHAGGKPGDKKTRIAITYVVDDIAERASTPPVASGDRADGYRLASEEQLREEFE
jgi:hypothetical protein